MEFWHRLLHVRKLLAQRNSGQSKVRSIYDGSFFSPWVCHQKGKLHRHRYGKKSGNKKYYLASQLMKKCKKRQFQRKHDGFLRSQKFRIRLIEHHRDEEVCQDGMLMRMKMTLTIRHNKNTSTQEQWIVHSLRQSTVTDGVCDDNTSYDPFARCKSVQQFGCRWNWRTRNTVWLQEMQHPERKLYIWYCVCVLKTNDTSENVTTKTQSTFNPKHMNSAIPQFVPLVWFLWSWLHTTSWLKFHLCASSHGNHIKGVFFHVESSIPFYFLIFPFIHNLLHFWHLTRPLLEVVTLRTSPEGRRTLLTNPTFSQVRSPRTTTSWRLMSSASQSPWPTHSYPSKVSFRMWITMTQRS